MVKFFVLSTILLSSFNVSAEVLSQSYDWNMSYYFGREEPTAKVRIDNKDEDGKITNTFIVFGLIRPSIEGKQLIYFSLQKVKRTSWVETCNINHFQYSAAGNYIRDEIWKFENRNVRMTVFCVRGNTGQYELQATPTSLNGESFVVNQFMKPDHQVQIVGTDFNIYMNTNGFKSLWEHFGGDAL